MCFNSSSLAVVLLPVEFVAVGRDGLGELRRVGDAGLIGRHSDHFVPDVKGGIGYRFGISAGDINFGTLFGQIFGRVITHARVGTGHYEDFVGERHYFSILGFREILNKL